MQPRAALILLTFVAPWLWVAMMLGGSGLVWLGVPIICGLPILLVIVGTARQQPPWWGLLAIWLLLTAGWLGIGWLSVATDLASPSPGEAFSVMVLLLLGLGLLPLILVGWLHARSFSDSGLTPEDMRRLRGEEES